MPEWDELFGHEEFQWREPAQVVVDFARELKARGARQVLDLGFGAGRHVVYLAHEGFEVYGTDISPRGLQLTRAWLQREGLHAELRLSDMTVIPYPDGHFHAVIGTNVIHHSTLSNIRRCVSEIHRVLAPGGRALLVVISKRSSRYGEGRELEPDTYLPISGADAGVPHHFFGESDLRDLLSCFVVTELRALELGGGEGKARRRHSHWAVTIERPAS